ncbi:MAG: lipid-A-disaccharide synthase [Nitrospira sp. SB0667_bin_9]|nr:lipid-A-disaccharide synthase [Nitrospira sp. SB0667_bin_9]MYD31429.1 lipid-A-disaccharide synthase [Nitrospira sp. SB0661_bin_20]MYJ23887.1 lipid-A-disaccharide synthase [Nitrospira sp. SB0673_bin_12]
MAGLSIMIVTGEASGDLHGANLAKALKELQPEVRLVGVGGQHMRAAGVELVQGLHRLDVVGIPGPLMLWKGFANMLTLKRFFRRESLDGVVFVDNPSMNLRLARVAAKFGHRVIYYIAPQIWAWGRHRINLIKRVVRRMIVILPFEEPIYRDANVPCSFVGHPLLDDVAQRYDAVGLRKQLGLPVRGLILGLLPGSRHSEIQSLLPTMLEAAGRIRESFPDLHCVIGRAPTVAEEWVNDVIDRKVLPVTVVPNQPAEVMAAADLLLVASGTATLQAALVGTPMILAYRVSWLTCLLARMLITVEYVGLVNLVAGRGVVPELLQSEVTAERLSAEALHLLKDRTRYDQMREALVGIRAELGPSGASLRAAEVVLEECQA